MEKGGNVSADNILPVPTASAQTARVEGGRTTEAAFRAPH